MDLVYGLLIGGVVGFIVAVFVYRNNAKQISKVADKVDQLVEVVKTKENVGKRKKR